MDCEGAPATTSVLRSRTRSTGSKLGANFLNYHISVDRIMCYYYTKRNAFIYYPVFNTVFQHIMTNIYIYNYISTYVYWVYIHCECRRLCNWNKIFVVGFQQNTCITYKNKISHSIWQFIGGCDEKQCRTNYSIYNLFLHGLSPPNVFNLFKTWFVNKIHWLI